MKTIGSKIKFFREERGMTQTDLAKKAKIAPAQISEYESGKAIPKIDKIIKIANALNVSTDDIDGRLVGNFNQSEQSILSSYEKNTRPIPAKIKKLFDGAVQSWVDDHCNELGWQDIRDNDSIIDLIVSVSNRALEKNGIKLTVQAGDCFQNCPLSGDRGEENKIILWYINLFENMELRGQILMSAAREKNKRRDQSENIG